MLTPEREAEIREYDSYGLGTDIEGIPARLHPSSPSAMLPDLLAALARLRGEVERLREQANADLRSFNAMGDQMRAARADAIRLAGALQREAEQSADGGIPESWAALAQHDERTKP